MILSDSTDKLKELDKQEARDIHIYSSLFILLLNHVSVKHAYMCMSHLRKWSELITKLQETEFWVNDLSQWFESMIWGELSLTISSSVKWIGSFFNFQQVEAVFKIITAFASLSDSKGVNWKQGTQAKIKRAWSAPVRQLSHQFF